MLSNLKVFYLHLEFHNNLNLLNHHPSTGIHMQCSFAFGFFCQLKYVDVDYL